MKDPKTSIKIALQNAQTAYKSGNLQESRYWAQRAVNLAPEYEGAWLWLAAVSNPRASIEYISHALEINPSSHRARKAMHWAVQRIRKGDLYQSAERIVDISIPSTEFIAKRPRFELPLLPLAAAFILLLPILLWILGAPLFSLMNVAAFSGRSQFFEANLNFVKSTRTPTSTYTPSPTFTPTPTSTPTETPTPLPTNTPLPTFTPEPQIIEAIIDEPEIPNNPGIGEGKRWIDVDLSNQRTYAYEGDQVIRSFIVSTGTWQYPTVTGQYHIYVKYDSAPMSGPGYYLPGVPFIMYFYKGYGIHGTYWHNNFGTPMSHGCVNLTIDDAEWLYHWASIGTLVNIHY